MKSRKKRTLTAAEKRALVTAGLMLTRYAPDGRRAMVEQLASEDSGARRREVFIRKLTSERKTSEGS